MEALLYLLLPFIWLWMLCEWIYKKLVCFSYWITGEPEPGRPGDVPDDRATTDREPGDDLQPPDKKKTQDDGMNPQERTLPYIIQQEPPEREPKKEPEQEPEPLPEFVYEPPKNPKKTINLAPERKDDPRDRGGRE